MTSQLKRCFSNNITTSRRLLMDVFFAVGYGGMTSRHKNNYITTSLRRCVSNGTRVLEALMALKALGHSRHFGTRTLETLYSTVSRVLHSQAF